MTKLAAPLLSLGAQGTIADTITFTRTNRQDIAKSIPTHPDAQTLAQFYQRCSFTDAHFYWASLTQTQKNAFRDQPHPPHLTAQQKAIRYYLKNLPDLSAAWSLDEPSGPTIHDRSKNTNHATTTGTTTTPAIIDHGLSFDGLDNYLQAPNNPSLQNFTKKTIAFWANRTALTTTWQYLYHAGTFIPPFGDTLYLHPTDQIAGWVFQNPSGDTVSQWIPFPTAQWHHYAYSWNGTTITLFVDATPQTLLEFTGPLACSASGLIIANFPGAALWYCGLIDDFRIYNRGLSQAHIAKIYSQQRWPPPS